MKVYSIFDEKAAAFLRPFFARAHGEAIRSVTNAVNDPKEDLSRHAADYTLFYIGDFDENTGVMKGVDKTSLGNLLEFKAVTTAGTVST